MGKSTGLIVSLLGLIVVLLLVMIFIGNFEITGKAVAVENNPSLNEVSNEEVEEPMGNIDSEIEELEKEIEKLNVEEPQVESNLPKYYDNFLVYGETDSFEQAVLIFDKKVDEVGESGPIIKLKKRLNVDYKELYDYFKLKGTEKIIIYSVDTEIGREIRDETGIKVIVNFGKYE